MTATRRNITQHSTNSRTSPPPADAISATGRCSEPGCEAKATAGPGTPAAPIMDLERQLCPGHLTAWFEARR